MSDWDKAREDLYEHLDALLEQAREVGYQDGLNDALAELRRYREQAQAGSDGENDQLYLDGVDDAILTVTELGAVDTAEVADTATEQPAVAMTPAVESDNDTDGM